jgi:hypothetical protein
MPNLPQWFVRNQRDIAERNRVPLYPISDICVNLRNLWTITLWHFNGSRGDSPIGRFITEYRKDRYPDME